MLNSLELAALSQAVSNEARVLYCLYLLPQSQSDDSKITIHNKDILALLNSTDKRISLGREISALFEELHHAGLIDIQGEHDFQKSLNRHRVTLLLNKAGKDLQDSDLHAQHQKISVSWRPDNHLFEQICALVGVIDLHFDAEELGEFIAYWLGRPESQHTPYQWTQKFVLHLKHRRIRKPISGEKSKVGHQWVETQAGIEFDDNVKKLVKKYSEQS
ncbi:DnaT-like ssDNA-binding domain-containing protein [Glaciecola siphonariae]|uniref:DnaT-like ssDNA-binding domain-containing protein n=1 Tax=Glaciecola siphonariae TaxID=521012 RepID=A0ABV9LT23_9ALTE